MPKPLILVVDDDAFFRQTIDQQIEALGFHSKSTEDEAVATRIISTENVSLTLLDLRLNDSSGLTLLKRWKSEGCEVPVVMISGQGTIPEAVEALRSGALDFLVKPVDINILHAVINRSIRVHQLDVENRQLKEISRAQQIDYLGESEVVKELLETARQVAATEHPILLHGETGTGKQVLAKYIYSSSRRSSEPFLTVNCAAISPNLFESELFGHEKGAFTSAHARKIGKLELVGNGTIFLDEIGELPSECQAKLLTAVEERTFERVGGVNTLDFKGRILAATNRDLQKEVANGTFRKDLYYRLNTFIIRLPALREHPADIPVYIDHALYNCSREYGRAYNPPTEDVLQSLKKYHWPGNIRELLHHVQRISLLSKSADIPGNLWLLPLDELRTLDNAVPATDLKDALDDFRMKHVFSILRQSGGNQTEAAKQLGIGRTYLNRLLNEHKQKE